MSERASRERLLAEAFVAVADSLTDEFDVVEFLQSMAVHSVELLGVSAAGFTLADSQGELGLVAASGGHAWVFDLFALQQGQGQGQSQDQGQGQGPGPDCYRSGTAQTNIALGDPEATTAWPGFAPRALAVGCAMTHVLPLRREDQALGTLQLFQTTATVLGPDEIALAQALVDIATIAILRRRFLEQTLVERDQLQSALTSRVVIEQAKGVLAERWQCTVDEAFEALRRHARTNRLRLTECARLVVAGEFDTEAIRRG
ncbi:ANTAR domain-containing response regulator [Streptomyces sp. NPDC048436]|uniref:ANTAR domain-containing response regulator n=1 Tax=Streptomyces sp. NPDC048436 TaxID=3365550 RepID=UPI0037136025